MKTIKFILNLFKLIIITGLVLFSLASFMIKAYGQTIIFLLIVITLAYWPKIVAEKWNKKIALDYPNIRIEVMVSGHLISVEHAYTINKMLSEFLTMEQAP